MNACPLYAGGNAPACSTPTTQVTTILVDPGARQADLPFTGGDVIGLSLIGTGLLLVGLAAAWFNRRRAA